MIAVQKKEKPIGEGGDFGEVELVGDLGDAHRGLT